MRNLLFTLRPKTSRKELFNRTKELSTLDSLSIRGDPLIMVTGIRRIGKTSLLRAFLEEWRGVYIDMRGVKGLGDIYRRVADGLSGSIDKLRDVLRGIRGVRVYGLEVELKWRGRDSLSISGLLEELDRKGERIIVIFDEAQEARGPFSREITSAIAYAYDNLGNVTVILSGSEVGLLEDFAGIYRPESPLYGRYAYTLALQRFPPDLSMEFLRAGFREAGVRVPSEVLETAVELFDGIVGWLVYFGRSYLDGVRDLDAVFSAAVRLASEELGKLSLRDRAVLKAIASGADSWSKVRERVAEDLGVVLPKSTLSRIIRKLEKLSIISSYRFLDPIYMEAARHLRIKD